MPGRPAGGKGNTELMDEEKKTENIPPEETLPEELDARSKGNKVSSAIKALHYVTDLIRHNKSQMPAVKFNIF